MGTNKSKPIIKHINTNINIKHSLVCRLCPFKIYAEPNDTVEFGVGNMFSNFIFVIPSYNTKTNKEITSLNAISKIYRDITGKNILEEIYVTRYVKCYKNTQHALINHAANSCVKYLTYEVTKLSAKNIIFFGDTYRYYENNNDLIQFDLYNKNIFNVYSPNIIMFDNDVAKDKLYETLTHILNNY